MADLLAKIDNAMRELAEIRAALVEQVSAPPAAEGNGLDTGDDFKPDELLEVSTASALFNRPADSLRWLCRHAGCGVKVGGRWMCSPRALRRRLNGE